MKFISAGIAAAALAAVAAFSVAPAQAQFATYYGGPGVSVGIGTPGLGFSISAGTPYYNGFAGFSDFRPGYRFYNGYWFPPSAFAVVEPAPVYGGTYAQVGVSAEHVQWCLQRYRSYRIEDNTFQPYVGPRQECISPFGQ